MAIAYSFPAILNVSILLFNQVLTKYLPTSKKSIINLFQGVRYFWKKYKPSAFEQIFENMILAMFSCSIIYIQIEKIK